MEALYFGVTVKQVRQARHMSQKDLSLRLNISIHMVRNIEQGKDPVTTKSALDYLEQLKVLNLSSDEISSLKNLALTSPQREKYRRKQSPNQFIIDNDANPINASQERLSVAANETQVILQSEPTISGEVLLTDPSQVELSPIAVLDDKQSFTKQPKKYLYYRICGVIGIILFIFMFLLRPSFDTGSLYVEKGVQEILSVSINGQYKNLLPINGIQHQHERLLPDPIQSNDLVEVQFTVRNGSNQLIVVCSIGAAGRGPNANHREWADDNYDLTSSDIIFLWPHGSYEYKQTRRFFEPGVYFIETVHESCDKGYGGLKPSPRIWFNVVP